MFKYAWSRETAFMSYSSDYTGLHDQQCHKQIKTCMFKTK